MFLTSVAGAELDTSADLQGQADNRGVTGTSRFLRKSPVAMRAEESATDPSISSTFSNEVRLTQMSAILVLTFIRIGENFKVIYCKSNVNIPFRDSSCFPSRNDAEHDPLNRRFKTSALPEDSTMKHLGQKIREERKELGFTIRHFAELVASVIPCFNALKPVPNRLLWIL